MAETTYWPTSCGDFELFGDEPTGSDPGLVRGDRSSWNSIDLHDEANSTGIERTAAGAGATGVLSASTHQAYGEDSNTSLPQPQANAIGQTAPQPFPTTRTSLPAQRISGLESQQYLFELTVQDFGEASTCAQDESDIQQGCYEISNCTSNLSEPWSPYTMEQCPLSSPHERGGFLIGPHSISMHEFSREGTDGDPFGTSMPANTTTPGTSPNSRADPGEGSPKSYWQPTASHDTVTIGQTVDQSYSGGRNGSVTAESYPGVPIDFSSDDHRQQSISLSRTSSRRLSVQRAPPSPTLTITPDFVEDHLKCNWNECNETFTGAFRRGNLARHIRLIHGKTLYPCGGHGCSRIFKRSDARLKHQRKKHPELGLLGPLSRR